MPDDAHDRLFALLDRYLAGECTSDDVVEVRAWLATDPSNWDLLERTRRIRDVAAARLPPRSAEAAWQRAVGELGLAAGGREIAHFPPRARPFNARRGSLRRSAGLAARIAAAVVMLVGGGLLIARRDTARPASPQADIPYNDYITKHGQRLSLRLPDGTLALLAPGTRLRRPADYGARARTLYLEGEAYFDVTHDSTRPFAIHTSQTIARDLGTKFIVRAYPNDIHTEVVVAEGEVQVGRSAGSAMPVLTTSQAARVDAGGEVTVRDVSLDAYLAWTQGRLVFDDTPLADVVVRLSRWFDVEVRLGDPMLGRRRLTASFDEQPVAHVIEKIAGPLGLAVHRNQRTYTLTTR